MLKPPPNTPSPSTTPFHPSANSAPFTVGDFWQWAFSDFKQNNLRGILAEFLVAKALDIPLNVRHTWDDFDLTTTGGLKIEVKAGGYLQSWKQKGLSKIVFGGLRGKVWDHDRCAYVGESTYRADVYIFAVQTAIDHHAYDPLDVHQWEFYVLPKALVAKRGTKSIALSTVQKLVKSVPFEGLQIEVGKIGVMS